MGEHIGYRPGLPEQDSGQDSKANGLIKRGGETAGTETDLMQGQVIDPLGTTGRELALKRKTRLAEGTIAGNPNHAHLEEWKQSLEQSQQALAQNESALGRRINALPAGQQDRFRQEYQRVLSTIESYDASMETTSNLNDRGKLDAERKAYLAQLEALEKQLPKAG